MVECDFNSKILVLEGVDNVGKSFLIEKLKKKLNAKVIKCSIRPKDASEKERARIQMEHDMILRFIEQKDFDSGFYIFDRYYPTEILYGKLKRGYDANENGFYSKLESRVKEHPHLFVHCTAPLEVHLKRYAERPDDYVSENELKELRLCYQIFFDNLDANKCTVDLSHDLDKVCLFILSEFNKKNFGQKTITEGIE